MRGSCQRCADRLFCEYRELIARYSPARAAARSYLGAAIRYMVP